MNSEVLAVPKKQRVYLFDNLKFLLIILVVVGHTILEYTEKEYDLHSIKSMFVFIYAFHMPLFLLVSGIFQSRKKDRFPIDKIVMYVVLGYLLKMLLPVSSAIFAGGKLNFSLFDGDGVFWYLFAMAGFTLICWIVRNVSPWVVYLFSVPLALLVGYDEQIGDIFVLSRLVVFFPFFYTGFVLEPEKVAAFAGKIYVKIISAVLVVAWAYLSFAQTDFLYNFRSLMTGRNSYKNVPAIENCSWIDRGFVMLIAALLCFAFIGISVNRRLPFISEAGTHTLAVYFWHKPVLTILLSIGTAEFLQKNFASVWTILLAGTGVVVACLLSISVFEKPLKAINNSILKAFRKR